MRRALALPIFLALAACQRPVPLPVPTGEATSASSSTLTPACGVSGPALGEQVAAAAGYAIHDTAPGSTEPRLHHVTGLSDGCPRAVTAALLAFGDISTYESLRAGRQAPTDAAYDELRARTCGGPIGTPCARLQNLARDTVFLSLYPVFGSEEHSDVLLHRGAVAAED